MSPAMTLIANVDSSTKVTTALVESSVATFPEKVQGSLIWGTLPESTFRPRDRGNSPYLRSANTSTRG